MLIDYCAQVLASCARVPYTLSHAPSHTLSHTLSHCGMTLADASMERVTAPVQQCHFSPAPSKADATPPDSSQRASGSTLHHLPACTHDAQLLTSILDAHSDMTKECAEVMQAQAFSLKCLLQTKGVHSHCAVRVRAPLSYSTVMNTPPVLNQLCNYNVKMTAGYSDANCRRCRPAFVVCRSHVGQARVL